jgi:hypothetical protein
MFPIRIALGMENVCFVYTLKYVIMINLKQRQANLKSVIWFNIGYDILISQTIFKCILYENQVIFSKNNRGFSP